MMDKFRVWKEKMLMSLAFSLPNKIVYLCAIKVGAHATTGAYSDQEVPKLTFMEALKRWPGKA